METPTGRAGKTTRPWYNKVSATATETASERCGLDRQANLSATTWLLSGGRRFGIETVCHFHRSGPDGMKRWL
jgi:hypothetical protein